MPAIGVIAPDHDERKARRAGRLPVWYPIEELKEKALYASPKWSPYSYELIAAAMAEYEERGDNISTTALTSPCPRSVVLERKADHIISMDDLWRAFRGTMVHYVLEAAQGPDSVAEVRFFAPLGDEVISCKPDLIRNNQMWDYKNKVTLPTYDYPYQSHVEQLQFNRWICNNATRWEKDDAPISLPIDVRQMEFEHLVVMYLGPDGPKPLECVTSIDVPTGPGAKYPTKKEKVPDIWDDEKVLWGWTDYYKNEIPGLVERYKDMRLALDSYPDFPPQLAAKWGGEADWRCPGFPHCPLKGMCLASRWPNGLTW